MPLAAAPTTLNYSPTEHPTTDRKAWSNRDASTAEAKEWKLIGQSPVMQKLFSVIARVAPNDSSVLITGATGTGKELVARAIHDQSPRREGKFVDVNCSAIPETLIEAELFGHQRGSFIGALANNCGLFEKASGGTLFLDEIDALNLSAQAKLLRVLPLHLPELCTRGNDVELLIEHFLRLKAEREGLPPRQFSSEAMRALVEYPWPGNVRELENAVAYAMAIGADEQLGLEDLPIEITNNRIQPNTSDFRDVLQAYMNETVPLAEIEKRYILSVLQQFGGNQVRAAAALGIDRSKLYRRLKQYGVMAVKFLQEEQNGMQLRTWSTKA